MPSGYKLSPEQCSRRVKQIHENTVTLDIATYKDTHSKALFRDIEYGEFWATPNSVICRGRGHPKRGINKGIINKIKPLSYVKDKIYAIHGDQITLDESTYKNTQTPCKFIDKDYGEWWTTPNSILAGHKHRERAKIKIQATNRMKYGCNYPAQNPEIALKAAKTANKITELEHWKTKKPVACQGSYEVAVVNYLNNNKIDFDWQILFKMPNNKTYRIDLYLINENKYIEIKGWFRQQISKEKWEWFHKTYPNSELWDRSKLKQLGIL